MLAQCETIRVREAVPGLTQDDVLEARQRRERGTEGVEALCAQVATQVQMAQACERGKRF